LITESQLNEDILELKQISKEIYSLLKKEGLMPSLVTKVDWGSEAKNRIAAGEKGGIPTNPKDTGAFDDGTLVQVVENDETCVVGIPFARIGRILGFTEEKNGSLEGWWKDQKLSQRGNEIGNKIVATIKAKYPNMVYNFDGLKDNFWYIMRFKVSGETKKGGKINPNQRPNAPKPQQESQLDEALNKDIKTFGQDLDKRFKEAGFDTLVLMQPATQEQLNIVKTKEKAVLFEVSQTPETQMLSLKVNPKMVSKAESIINKFQLSNYDGPVLKKGWTSKQVQGAINPGDIVSQKMDHSRGEWYFYRLAKVDTKVKNVQAESIEQAVNEALRRFRKGK